VEGHVGQDDTIFEQERGFQAERPLIVQNILPPPSRKNLGDDDGDPMVLVFL
jgi:hypothetical protein